jgi:hypothetical protein
MNSLFSTVLVLLPQLVLISVYVVGLVLSATKLRHYRKAAALGMAGFGVLLLAQLVRAGSSLALPAFTGSMSSRELGAWFAITGWISTTLTLTGAILVLLAILADRDERH